jgi:hypothetical protein
LNHREISLDFRQSEIRLQIWAAEVFPIGWEMQTNGRNLGGQDMPAFQPDFTLPEIQAVSPAVQINFQPLEIWLIAV